MSEEEFFAALAEICMSEERRAPEVKSPKKDPIDALAKALIAGPLTRTMSTFFSSPSLP